MIVYEGPGNLFDSPSQTIACPINAAGAMGKGLALAFRHRFPGLYERYLELYPRVPWSQINGREFWLHTWWIDEYRQVLLFPTKDHWNNGTTQELICRNLKTLADNFTKLNITSLALPALGCGNGGLNYEREVRHLIHRYLDPIGLPVQVYVGR